MTLRATDPVEGHDAEWLEQNTPWLVYYFYEQVAGFATRIAEVALRMVEGKEEVDPVKLSHLTGILLQHEVFQESELMLEMLTKLRADGVTLTEQEKHYDDVIQAVGQWITEGFAKDFAGEMRAMDAIRERLNGLIIKGAAKPVLYGPSGEQMN